MTSTTRPVLQARIRAFAVHLTLSVLVATVVALLVFVAWFPPPYREISGGGELFTLVVAVDVVLGPLITLLVFDRRKPSRELRRDLSIVVILQIAGLLYGLHTVYLARPAILALEGTRLRVVRVADLDGADWAAAPPEFRSVPLVGMHHVATRAPTAAEKSDAVFHGLEGIDLGMQPEFWLPAAQTQGAWLAASRPIQQLRAKNRTRVAAIDAAVVSLGRDDATLRYLPMLARSTKCVALIDASSGALVGYAPVEGND
jgi:hypothetical protein